MLRFKDLCARRCVDDLIRVVHQVPVRWAARTPMHLDDASVAALVLWTLLRWERTFLLAALEEIGVDMWAFTCDVDALLSDERAKALAGEADAAAAGAALPASPWELDRYVGSLLDRAELEAVALKHHYLGTEHVLLAVLSGADARLSSILARHDVTHEKVKRAVVAALERAAEDVVPAEVVDGETAGSAGTWGGEAVGVPRRFGMAVLLLLVTMYAVLFSAMQLFDAHPTLSAVIAVLFTGVGLGQMLLYGGTRPRAASVWVGACLFPAEILVVLLVVAFFPSLHAGPEDLVPLLVLLLVFSFPLGAGLGYMAGSLAAGVFLLIERYRDRRDARTSE